MKSVSNAIDNAFEEEKRKKKKSILNNNKGKQIKKAFV